MKNKTFCIAEDYVNKIFDILEAAERPMGFEDLTLLISPEIPLDTDDLPFIAINVYSGDEADQTETKAMDNSGRFMVATSLIALNFRVNITEQSNNGIKAIAPLHKWAMRQLMNSRDLKSMCQGPIIPAGWGKPYGDTHEIAGKGAIQMLKFRHVLDLSNAWNEIEVNPNPNP